MGIGNCYSEHCPRRQGLRVQHNGASAVRHLLTGPEGELVEGGGPNAVAWTVVERWAEDFGEEIGDEAGGNLSSRVIHIIPFMEKSEAVRCRVSVGQY